DGIRVRAEAEVGGVAEAEDAGKAPHQPEREGEERPDEEQRRRVGVRHRRQDEPGPADTTDAEARAAGHVEFLKKRPVMPCGMRRSRMIASASIAISPMTGVEPNETTWFTAPKMIELASVPEMTAAPPVMTVMKAFAM